MKISTVVNNCIKIGKDMLKRYFKHKVENISKHEINFTKTQNVLLQRLLCKPLYCCKQSVCRNRNRTKQWTTHRKICCCHFQLGSDLSSSGIHRNGGSTSRELRIFDGIRSPRLFRSSWTARIFSQDDLLKIFEFVFVP